MIKSFLASFALIGCAFPAQAHHSSHHPSCSLASHYGIGDGYHGKRTASGQIFDAYQKTAAHRTLPFGTKLKVFNPNNGKSVTVTINDRGPYIPGRLLDLSYGAFAAIASPSTGVTTVCIA